MSKGNASLYNAYVVLIVFLFSTFIFVVAGASVVFALAITAYFSNEVIGFTQNRTLSSMLTVCMISLTVVIGLFNLCAISMNIRLPKNEGSEK
ncbi:hypothetical protein MNBD_UNCLBAC01-451 [hydrothermal vent metagenome]|uniref:Uncharacterized protein n=1 Tax=hydrothermal vent metagenome TaxID=652676 RepID=A0A3B1E2K4_9ZZZZ